jgi:hypothetical protein
MNRQTEILRQVAERHGIGIGQAEEVWTLFGRMINQTISNVKKNEDGFHEIENFPVIHIDNFGKFIPRVKYINRLNKLREDERQHNIGNE